MILTFLDTSCFGVLWLWKDPVRESMDASRFIISKHQKCVPKSVSKLQMKICSVAILISAPSFFRLFQKRDSKLAPVPNKSVGRRRSGWCSSHIFPLGRLCCLGRPSTDPEVLAHLFRTVCNSAKYRVRRKAVLMHRRVQGTDIGEKGEHFITSTQIAVPAALTHNCSLESPAFPACTVSFKGAKLGLPDQSLGKQGHGCVCLMCTLICSWNVLGAHTQF